MSGFGMISVATPLGTINFPMMPGIEAKGSAVVDPDGTVKIHIVIEPSGRSPRRHMVYSAKRKTDPASVGSLGLLDIKLLRDDGAFEL